MVRVMAGAAVLSAMLAFAGPAAAQGFSESGAAGVAAMRGTTASPGYISGGLGTPSGSGMSGGVDTPVAMMPESAARPRRPAPTDVDFAPRNDRSGPFGLPF